MFNISSRGALQTGPVWCLGNKLSIELYTAHKKLLKTPYKQNKTNHQDFHKTNLSMDMTAHTKYDQHEEEIVQNNHTNRGSMFNVTFYTFPKQNCIYDSKKIYCHYNSIAPPIFFCNQMSEVHLIRQMGVTNYKGVIKRSILALVGGVDENVPKCLEILKQKNIKKLCVTDRNYCLMFFGAQKRTLQRCQAFYQDKFANPTFMTPQSRQFLFMLMEKHRLRYASDVSVVHTGIKRLKTGNKYLDQLYR